MIRGRLMIVSVTLAGVLLTSARAESVEVYLNGVQVTGAKDQVIEKAKVTLDKEGNVYISAPDYKVRELGSQSGNVSPPPNAPTTNAHLKRKYFVVTEVSRPKMTGYTIQVIINSKFLRNLSDEIPQDVLELNNYLNEGGNSVSFRAFRPEGKSAQSTLASDFFTVVLGEGKGQEGAALTIDNVLGEFKVTAIDQGEKAQTFDINAK